MASLVATATVGGMAAAAVVSAPAAHAAFPGANGPIVFAGVGGTATTNLVKLDPSTGTTTTLCSMCAHGDQVGVSSDGQTVFFSTNPLPCGAASTCGLASISINGGTITSLSGTINNDVDAAVTPDGSKVVLRNVAGGGLVSVSAGGFGSRSTISGTPTAAAAAEEEEVSPDGATVAYLDHGAGDCLGTPPCVKTIPIGGGVATEITTGGVSIDRVSWSPDGSKIALAVAGGIAVVSGTGNNQAPKALANSVAGDIDPAWSPDGTKIVAANAGNAVIFASSGAPGRTTLPVPGAVFGEDYWAPAASSATTTTTPGATSTTTPGATTTTLCKGTLSGTAYKGGSAKPKKALAGLTVKATPTSGTAAAGTTNSAGAYSITVPCGTYTKSATGPATSGRTCHFGSGNGPTTGKATVTSGSNDTENLFCKKK